MPFHFPQCLKPAVDVTDLLGDGLLVPLGAGSGILGDLWLDAYIDHDSVTISGHAQLIEVVGDLLFPDDGAVELLDDFGSLWWFGYFLGDLGERCCKF